ncbi:beta-galactosidase [Mucilaginibacter mallensis]|uniref:Beta-galactosidase n=1 Tax=Mucilaginibacter mallensis TaxID=652787 RepID=A0A1H1X2Q9_MUCMA|nr:beta-galactosidase GalA [Mucilaginibacter mallensis]SDT03627.1 beta-galactosidase [Mucilaginibacter mallensis]
MKNKYIIKRAHLVLLLLIIKTGIYAQSSVSSSKREHLSMDNDWRFALGHAYDPAKDFNNGTGGFSYFAKAGYGDGAASPQFDDRGWRKINLPHDWAVELPFSPKGSTSHGSKAIGRNFPEASVGWYRKAFFVPAADLGKHISIAFDGVFRNSIVWVNGHYLGTEASGYNSFEYNISEYLNYGGDNIIAVRVDVTMEEGWFYEGAGIYRHVWLNKTDQLHIQTNGTYVTTQVKNNIAGVSATATVINDDKKERSFSVTQTIIDTNGKALATSRITGLTLKPFASQDVKGVLAVAHPKLWSIETPYLHKLLTTVEENGAVVDSYITTFGIRTIRFDANAGFFLNGKRVEIKGTDNHQDHAGVGTAMPDALQDFRIHTLKSMGCNAYRCSHNPPTPELLDACDRLGMVVIDENRSMGVASTELNDLKTMILRDRNHPCIISWSIGNEEWAIEGNITGARIAGTMQAFAKSVDSTRYITAAISGGIGSGISTTIDLLGYNYIATKNTDEQHKKYPNQFSWGTEEGSTVTSRGIYVDDMSKHQLAAYDRKQNDFFYSLEQGWKYYAARPYLAGMFIWTGFDYRGEPVPFGWPSIESYFGMLDACGFPKDDYYYLKSWWTDQTVVHLLPHWNWQGKEGQEIRVCAYSNCDEVELFLNKKSLGKKAMEPNGHLEWQVKYEPGTLEAIGYKKGLKAGSDVVKTTSSPDQIKLQANQPVIKADGKDIAIITVKATDKNNLVVPTADNEIGFSINGPGKIIGVGNGNQTSHEPDQYLERGDLIDIGNLKEKFVDDLNVTAEVAAGYDDSGWQNAFKDTRDDAFGQRVKALVYRASFNIPADGTFTTATFFSKSIGKTESIFINGKEIAHQINDDNERHEFKLDASLLHPGSNTIAIVATPLLKANIWADVNTDPGLIQLVYPALPYKRKLFNGYAQVIVQSTGQPGTIILKAASPGLKEHTIEITAANR